MAFILPKTCSECGETKNVNAHAFDGTCPECRAKIADKKKREYLAGLKGLTIKERLERIEEEVYDTNASARLKSLENKNVTFA